MSDICINVSLPTYLRQWLINAAGGTGTGCEGAGTAGANGSMTPIKFAKGSPYNSFLREFLRHKRECERFRQWTHDCVRIVVPHFPGRDPQYYNYLSPSAEDAFVEMVRDFFDGELARVVRKFHNIGKCRYNIMTTWMLENGIEIDDRNTCAVLKRWQLIQSRISATERQKKLRGGRRKGGEKGGEND